MTQDTLTDLVQNIRDETERKVEKAIEELPNDIPRTEDVKCMIPEELKEHRDNESSATGQDSITKDENDGWLEKRSGQTNQGDYRPKQ